MRPIIWGTAGHIDHGKTALMKAMTGTNTDRLSEEQERGLTIDIGFAFLTDEISFIDVPGHEKFVKNMVAGVSTIDAGLLVVAADDGVMPQSVEHLGILQLLGIQTGCIALTKIDLVDEEWLQLVESTIYDAVRNTFLQEAKIIRTSAESGEGIEDLKSHIITVSETIPRRFDRRIPRLPVDRSFTVKGYGTVVTGSVLSGTFDVNALVELLPERKMTKVRGVQTHGHDVSSVGMGSRAALNLTNVSVEEIDRGDQLTKEGMLQVTEQVYAQVHMLEEPGLSLEQNQRIRLHLGTAEVLARCSLLDTDEIQPGETGFVKFRLEEKAIVGFADKFIIRFYSPMQTIGGGKILYPNSVTGINKYKLLEMLELLNSPEIKTQLSAITRLHGNRLLSKYDFSRELFYNTTLLEEPIERLVKIGQVNHYVVDGEHKYGNTASLEEYRNDLLNRIINYLEKNPREPGVPKSQLLQQSALPEEAFEVLMDDLLNGGKIVEEGALLRVPEHSITLTDNEEDLLNTVEMLLRDSDFQPPTVKELVDDLNLPEPELQQFIKILQYQQKIERISGDIFLHFEVKNRLKSALIGYFNNNESLTIGEFKELINGTRKYAIPLIEFADQKGWTLRKGDKRIEGNLT